MSCSTMNWDFLSFSVCVSSSLVLLHKSFTFLFECLANKDEAAIRRAITRQKMMKNYRTSDQLEICAHTVIMLFPCDPKLRYDRLNGLMNFFTIFFHIFLIFGSPTIASHILNALYVTWWLCTIFKLLWLDDNKEALHFIYLWFASRGRIHNYFFPWNSNLQVTSNGWPCQNCCFWRWTSIISTKKKKQQATNTMWTNSQIAKWKKKNKTMKPTNTHSTWMCCVQE